MAARRFRQYQSIAPALTTPPEFALDWLPTYPSALRRLRRPPEFPALSVPVFVELFGELSWLPRYPNTLRRKRPTDPGFFVEGEPAIAPIVVPDGLPWAPTYPDVLRRLRRPALHDDSAIFFQQELVADGTRVATTMALRRKFLYQASVEPLVTLSNFVLDWTPTYPTPFDLRPLRPRALDFYALEIGWFLDRQFPANAVKPWRPFFPDALRRLRSNALISPAFFMHLGTPIIPTVASWEPSFPDRLRPNRIDRGRIPFSPVAPILPIPDVTPTGGTVLNYRQQKSWYRSSSG